MPESRGSVVTTCVLGVALVAGNWWLMTFGADRVSLLVAWPVLFLLCTIIAARIFRGHSSL